VWVPKRGGKEKDVPVATRLVPDARATHYWDGSGVTMRTFQSVLGIPEDAWDVYLVYGPGARWEGELPPKPDYWMHQLGSRGEPRVNGPYLDPNEFAQRATALLGAR
jgi:hypothetical protein